MKRLWRVLRPVDGAGMTSYRYCDATMRGQACVVREPHGYRHVSDRGFRWAA